MAASPDPPDPLLDSLCWMGRFHGLPVHPAGALHGLPLVGGRLTPALFCRAAKRCGFTARILRRPLTRIHGATCPAILLFQGDQAAILCGRHPEGGWELSPVAGAEPETKVRLSLADVEARYAGFAILVKPVRQSEARSRLGRPDAAGSGAGKGNAWFWGTLWRFRGFFGRVILATVVINLLALASSLFVMNVYDRVVPNQATDTLWVLAAGVLCAYVFEFTLKSLRTFFVDRAGHRIDLILGSELFSRVLGMRFANRPASAGTLAGQARSYEALREFFASATVAALVDLPFVFVFAGIVGLLGGVTAVPLVVGAVVAIGIGAGMQIPIAGAVARSYRAGNQRQALFVEGVNALEWIKATRAESQMQARFEESVHESASAEGRSRAYAQVALNLTALTQQMVSTAIIVVAYFQVIGERMTMGAMIACVILAGRAMAPLGLVASLLTRLQQSRRSLQGLGEIMASPQEREDRGGRYLGLPTFEGGLVARDVEFSHHPEPGAVLRGVSFAVRPGERVALLGRIGSGKSTLLRLLMGLYPCSAGSITAGGIDLRQIDPAEWRSRVGYVPQDPGLFYGTLRSNLTAGCPGATDEAIWTAVRRAGLGGFVQGLPRGLDHPVEEGARNLSGGQRQALCLARAWIENPTVLLLDEPTSAIDHTTERHVIQELDAYLKGDPGRTLVVATHRRTLLHLVERVIVIDGGRVLADGPREQVLRGLVPGAIRKPPEPEGPDLALAPTHCPDMAPSPTSR